MSGWFKVHRGWMDSFKPEPFTDREAFLWSVEQAAYEPHTQWFNGQQIAVERSEFATSTRKMAKAFKWGEKRVRLFIARMERCGKWTQRTAHQGPHLATIITVCNYDFYQSRQADEDAPEDAPKGAAGAHQGRTEDAQQKKGKKVEEGKEGKEAKASPSPALPYSEALSIWTEFAGRHGWKPLNATLTEKRRKGLGRVLAAYGIDGWRACLERAAASELLGGPDPPAWFNFTFLCSIDNFTKTYEGNYDRSFDRSSKQQRQSSWGDINARCGGSVGAPVPTSQPLLLEAGQRPVAG